MATGFTGAKRGCWTCKERKVQCDRGYPTCQKCAQSKRHCQGYGFRLSWPKNNDRKRTILGKPPKQEVVRTKLLFVNTTYRDVELHLRTFTSYNAISNYPVAINPGLTKQPSSPIEHTELFSYFYSTAYLSLISFNCNTVHLRDTLLHMALSHDSISGQALVYSLLAFSSLRHYGLQKETLEFKAAALEHLSASAQRLISGSSDAALHITACMLLCSFEILLQSEDSSEWLWYVRAAMSVIQGVGLAQGSTHGDIDELIDWVSYHETLSRFTLSHQRRHFPALDMPKTKSSGSYNIQPVLPPKFGPVRRLSSPVYEMLNLLADVCDVLIDPRDPLSQKLDYKCRLRDLEQTIHDLSLTRTTATDPVQSETAEQVELYQTATLVYLVRASQTADEPATDISQLLDKAYTFPVKSPCCSHFFPLFILACEAKTDERRAAILALLDRTEKHAHVRSMRRFRNEIISFWIQHDLVADLDIVTTYFSIMSAVISSSERALPSFV